MALSDIATLERLRTPRSPLILLLCALVITPGCRSTPTGIDEETYVHVMAHLAWARARYLDASEVDSARAALLDRFGVSGEELVAFADEHGDEVERFAGIMERIRTLVDSLDTVPIGVDPDEGLLQLDSLSREPS